MVKGLNSENVHYFGVYTAAMGLTNDTCWLLRIKTLLLKNNKKREAALKNEAGGDEKHAFFYLASSLLLVLGVSRSFEFESVIQRNTAGPNIHSGPAAVEGKFGLKMDL